MKFLHNRYAHIAATLLFSIFSILGCIIGVAPTPPSTNIQPTQDPLEFTLVALRSPVSVTRGDQSSIDAEKDQPVSVKIGDKVIVGPGGRANMSFGSRIQIEFLQTAELELTDMSMQAGDTLLVKATQDVGHIHVTINKDANLRLTLNTSIVTIRNLVDDTEFIVCHDPTLLTCKDVLRGEIEVEAQGKVRTFNAEEGTYTLLGKTTSDPICEHTNELQTWLAAMRNGEKQPALGELVSTWYSQPCPGEVVQEPTVAPGETAAPTPTPTTPAGPYVQITNIQVDSQGRYVVEYQTFGYTPQLPGTHIHFFFNTVYPENAGVPGNGPWILYGGPNPFTGYRQSDKPAAATQMCALVANPNHSVQLNTGNCMNLP